MNHAQRYIPWILLVALCATFPVIGKTIDDLRRSMAAIARGHFTIAGPFQGENTIPPTALAGIHILRNQGVSEYQVSSAVHNTYDYQRITEGAWPIRLTGSSSARLFLSTETVPNFCAKKEQQGGIILALCR